MSLTVERTSPTTLTITRRFRAPPARVWAAHVEPDLIRRWCHGPEGWTMTTCEIDPRAGGAMHYAWTGGPSGAGFELTATIEVAEPPQAGRPGRFVHVETMHLPDPTPENRVETTFAPDGPGANPGTLMTMVMEVAEAATMEAMVATGMTNGMEMGYARIDAMEPAEA